jgi:hypothetical protein
MLLSLSSLSLSCARGRVVTVRPHLRVANVAGDDLLERVLAWVDLNVLADDFGTLRNASAHGILRLQEIGVQRLGRQHWRSAKAVLSVGSSVGCRADINGRTNLSAAMTKQVFDYAS